MKTILEIEGLNSTTGNLFFSDEINIRDGFCLSLLIIHSTDKILCSFIFSCEKKQLYFYLIHGL